jgi:branched-subunit amino acid transport protein
MSASHWELILGMALVTAIPRLLPMLVDLEQWLPPALVRSLGFVPPAALGALIVPGLFQAAEHTLIAFTALVVASVLALPKRSPLILTVALTLLACWGVRLLLE